MKTMIMGTADTIRPIYKAVTRHLQGYAVIVKSDPVFGPKFTEGHEYALMIKGGLIYVLVDGEIDEHAPSCDIVHAYGYIGRHKYVRMSGREWW